MSEEKKEYTIKETLEVVDYADALVDHFQMAKSNDGKIDAMEAVTAMTMTIPKGLAAVAGAWDVDDELANLSQAEKDELLAKTMPVVLKLVRLFVAIPEVK